MPNLLSNFQRRVFNSVLMGKNRWTMLPGGRYGGKTFSAIGALMAHGERFPGEPRQLLGGTGEQDIRGNSMEALLFWSDYMSLPFRWPRGGSELTVGRQIWEVRGLKHSDGDTRVKGKSYVGTFIDEFSRIDPTCWHIAYTSTRGPGSRGILAWNPLSPRDWVEELRNNPDSIKGKVFDSDMKDNWDHGDRETITAFLESGKAMPDYQYKRLILGIAASPEGLVYPYWTPGKLREDRRSTACYVGVDYGEAGITAAVFYQAGVAVREYYYDGHIRPKRTSAEHARAIIQVAPSRIERCWIDPSAVSLRDALRMQGVSVTNAHNDHDGFDITEDALKSGKALIDVEGCPNTVIELEGLVFSPGMEHPDPTCANHGTDALRYLLCGVSEIGAARIGSTQYDR